MEYIVLSNYTLQRGILRVCGSVRPVGRRHAHGQPDEVRCHLLETEPLISRDGADTPREETPTAQNYNLQEMERKLILDVLNKTGGNKSKAAELLGITREGLRKKLLRMGINDKELPHDDGKA